MDATVLLRRLRAIAEPTPDERSVLSSLPGAIREYRAHEDIVRLGDRPSVVCLMLDGMTCRYKLSADGKRQIMSFHIQGDIPDLQSLFISVMDHSVSALVNSTALAIPHDNMRNVLENYPRVAHLLWRETLIDAALYREWIVIRDRPAYVRVAHLLCEQFRRMQAVGLATDDSCPLPLTQAQIGDALGLSNVHVNRTLMVLRTEEMIRLQGGRLTILDWEGLKTAGEFDPQYLHIRHAA